MKLTLDSKTGDLGKYETCIVCKREISMKIETPIEKRLYYVECVGQLCAECHTDLYQRK